MGPFSGGPMPFRGNLRAVLYTLPWHCFSSFMALSLTNIPVWFVLADAVVAPSIEKQFLAQWCHLENWKGVSDSVWQVFLLLMWDKWKFDCDTDKLASKHNNMLCTWIANDVFRQNGTVAGIRKWNIYFRRGTQTYIYHGGFCLLSKKRVSEKNAEKSSSISLKGSSSAYKWLWGCPSSLRPSEMVF